MIQRMGIWRRGEEEEIRGEKRGGLSVRPFFEGLPSKR